ncbi:MAG: hypothetical protein ACREJM_02300, partial [Candidatus Saccharimonadales bacterium]
PGLRPGRRWSGWARTAIIITVMRIGGYLRLSAAGFVVTMLALSLSPAAASSANISHSYHASTAIKDGSLVSLDSRRSDYVVPSNVDNGSQLLGIAVAEKDSLIAVDSMSGAIQVATTGVASAFVSTLNGDINVGDAVGVSPFNGVGMKAEPGSRVIGLAQTAFNGGTQGATTEKVTDKSGHDRTVKLGYVRVNIAISTEAAASAGNSNGLQKAVKALTGRTIPTQRIILSIAVAIVALLALITLVYASIYGSIVSIGRNPLAKYAVFRTLGAVLGLALLTTVVSGVIIYFLLK